MLGLVLGFILLGTLSRYYSTHSMLIATATVNTSFLLCLYKVSGRPRTDGAYISFSAFVYQTQLSLVCVSDLYVDARPSSKHSEPHSCNCKSPEDRTQPACGDDCLNRYDAIRNQPYNIESHELQSAIDMQSLPFSGFTTHFLSLLSICRTFLPVFFAIF